MNTKKILNITKAIFHIYTNSWLTVKCMFTILIQNVIYPTQLIWGSLSSDYPTNIQCVREWWRATCKGIIRFFCDQFWGIKRRPKWGNKVCDLVGKKHAYSIAVQMAWIVIKSVSFISSILYKNLIIPFGEFGNLINFTSLLLFNLKI